MDNKYLNQYLDYLKYQKAYSAYTIKSYEEDIIEFFDFCSKETLDFINI